MAASIQRKAQTVDHDTIETMHAKVIDMFERQSGALTISGRLLDDGVIDPHNAHKVLTCIPGVCDEARRHALYPIQFSVARL